MLELGSLSFHVVKRGDHLGLRVKDRDNPARAEFKGTDYYPADRKWVVNARFEPYEPPKHVPILNVLGMETEENAPGTLAFEVDGREYRLQALKEKGEEQFFIIFADQTSGKETYGAGRYLYADPPAADGRVKLDFNRAYSPPCAFTRYATCPLPPAQNRLPLRVEAGERYLGHYCARLACGPRTGVHYGHENPDCRHAVAVFCPGVARAGTRLRRPRGAEGAEARLRAGRREAPHADHGEAAQVKHGRRGCGRAPAAELILSFSAEKLRTPAAIYAQPEDPLNKYADRKLEVVYADIEQGIGTAYIPTADGGRRVFFIWDGQKKVASAAEKFADAFLKEYRKANDLK